MKSLFKKSLLFVLALSAVSCFNESSPNYQYFPDMYEPIPYEPYGEYEIFLNGQSAMLPAEGSVPRGWKPYDYENSQDGYQAAKSELTNPLPYTEDNLAKGRQLYTIYCAVCHGDQGDGQGIMVQREKILGIPRFDDEGRNITEGSVYHVMYYGLNAMGSYASQTSIDERWLIDHYVMNLKNNLQGGEERAFEEEATQEEEAQMKNLIPAVNEERDQLSDGNQGSPGTDNDGQENQNEE
ncbi:c-type cytochrome [Antarcticibacterium flavum]|uniref:C-type cytochrome n=1 Tax=Antarcticibacterium flavum TaxID=2058175 RepID=A0A5B7X5Y1_9FLAO|nr:MULTISPECIES: c-type cytochrome [Antarcticibacterium]MCM4158347.1 cytochrome C [Antarcticibacterium sp. W02-3]QCY70111.1 c-type cytochrome [Antarcticibacterium flavum]